MATVFLGLGSNIDPVDNLRLGISELRSTFGQLHQSPVYRSPPLGFDGADFLNLVVRLATDWTPQRIHEELERIHALAGRVRSDSVFVARTLDIDLLLYDQLVLDEPPLRLPRNDVLEYAFVLKPLVDIAPGTTHPLTGRTVAEEWADFAAEHQPLQRVSVIL